MKNVLYYNRQSLNNIVYIFYKHFTNDRKRDAVKITRGSNARFSLSYRRKHYILAITKVKREDSGSYVLMSDVGHALVAVNLTVFTKPRFSRNILRNVFVDRGKDAILQCPANPSFPVPVITWYHGDVKVGQVTPSTVALHFGPNYTLRNTSADSAGTYTCRLTASIDNFKYKPTFLSIKVTYSPTIEADIRRVPITLGGAITLMCRSSLGQNSPSSVFYWTRRQFVNSTYTIVQNSNIYDTSVSYITTNQHWVMYLTVKNIQRYQLTIDAFSCVVKSTNKFDSWNFTLVDNSPTKEEQTPQMLTTPTNQLVVNGTTHVQLHCETKSIRDTVIWTSTDIGGHDTDFKFQGGLLKLPPVKLPMKYTCRINERFEFYSYVSLTDVAGCKIHEKISSSGDLELVCELMYSAVSGHRLFWTINWSDEAGQPLASLIRRNDDLGRGGSRRQVKSTSAKIRRLGKYQCRVQTQRYHLSNFTTTCLHSVDRIPVNPLQDPVRKSACPRRDDYFLYPIILLLVILLFTTIVVFVIAYYRREVKMLKRSIHSVAKYQDTYPNTRECNVLLQSNIQM